MATRWLDRALFIGLLTAAYAGVAALVVLLCGGAAPDWLVPTAVVLACLTPRTAPSLAASPRRSAARALVAVLLLTVGGAVTYGALATESRHWDGAVAWDAKANRLAASPTLEQPYFRDRHVYSHSRDYPLLQPVTVALLDRAAGVGRILFPCALLTACAAIGLALRRRSRDELVPLLAVAAFAVTPNLVNPTSGAFDSGYSDGALTATVTLTLAGMVTRDRAWVLLGCLLMVLCKPEGLFYGALITGVLWLRAGSTLAAAATGWAAGAGLQLSLARDLQTFGESSAVAPSFAVAAALGAALVASDRWLGQRPNGAKLRLRCALVGIPALLVLGPFVLLQLSDAPGTFQTYFADPSRVFERLGRLPTIAAALAHYGFGRGAFALTWALPLLVWWATRDRPRDDTVATLALTLLGMTLIWFAPFLLSPIDDLDHHLRSTLPRLLDHGVGAAWLLTGVGLLQLREEFEPLAEAQA